MPYTITIRDTNGATTTTRLPDDAALLTHVRAASLPARIPSDLRMRHTVTLSLRDGSDLTAHRVTALDATCPTCRVDVGVPCQGPSGRTRRHGPHPARFTAAGLNLDA